MKSSTEVLAITSATRSRARSSSSLEPETALAHVELPTGGLPLLAEPLLSTFLSVDTQEVQRHVVLLVGERCHRQRLTVVRVREALQRHDIADEAVVHDLLVPLRQMSEDDVAHRGGGRTTVVRQLGQVRLDGGRVTPHPLCLPDT